MYKKWTEEEIEYVLNNHKNIDFKSLAKIIDRSENAVYDYLRKHNLSIIKPDRKKNNVFAPKTIWTDDDINILKEKYPYYTNKQMLDFLPDKTPDGIRTMANKNGIIKSSDKRNKRYNKDVMIKDLKELSEQLGRTPTHMDIFLSNLPSTKSYKRYFGTYTNACIESGLIPNYSDKNRGCKYVYLSKNKDLCYSNYELIITNFFIDNNIGYKKECLYSDYFNDKRCNTKRVDWIINNDLFIEFCGYPEDNEYMNNIFIKEDICKSNNFNFLKLYRKDIKNLHKIFNKYLSVETIQ